MGMFDYIKGKMICPVCGIITEMEGQTKHFSCGLNTLDIYNLPWSELNSYNSYNKHECPEYSYGYWNEGKTKKWHAIIGAFFECKKCGVRCYGEIVYSNDTYTKRKPTNDWVFEGISINEVDPASLMYALHKIEKNEYIPNFSEKGKWKNDIYEVLKW
jgi:hypothetical protein